jgi:osmotically inducible lipoprotein OsmB
LRRYDMKIQRHWRMSITTLTLLLTVAACSEPLSRREKGAVIGGGAGAAGGALIGGMTGAPGTGALIGGAAGAVGGALVGDEKDRRRRND